MSSIAREVKKILDERYTPGAPTDETAIAVIRALEAIPTDAAEDVRAILKEESDDSLKFDFHDFYVAGPDPGEWLSDWWRMEQGLKPRNLFFNVHAGRLLAKIFDPVQTERCGEVLPKGTPVYRARVFGFGEESKLKAALMRPDEELGPPPSRLATDGRMNARGISVFYGATDPKVAISEVRPPVGSKVLVGTFELTSSLCLLDVDKFKSVSPEPGSLFDQVYRKELRRVNFLQGLVERISFPVLPGQEGKYFVTQAVAEYLSAFSKFDGIIYPSVQSSAGRNVVLFPKSAQVQAMPCLSGTQISVRPLWPSNSLRNAGQLTRYEVVAKRSTPPQATPRPVPVFAPASEDTEPPPDEADTSLLRFLSVRVHYVKSVCVKTDSDDVSLPAQWVERAR